MLVQESLERSETLLNLLGTVPLCVLLSPGGKSNSSGRERREHSRWEVVATIISTSWGLHVRLVGRRSVSVCVTVA
jgi:hypothetical protein